MGRPGRVRDADERSTGGDNPWLSGLRLRQLMAVVGLVLIAVVVVAALAGR